jgi:hypothetical protein
LARQANQNSTGVPSGISSRFFFANDCGEQHHSLPLPMARELRTDLRIERMATKIKMLKLLTEAEASAEIDRRPPKPALYLMQMRTRSFQPALPKRRLPIRIQPEDSAEPVPVKIILLKPETKA